MNIGNQDTGPKISLKYRFPVWLYNIANTHIIMKRANSYDSVTVQMYQRQTFYFFLGFQVLC